MSPVFVGPMHPIKAKFNRQHMVVGRGGAVVRWSAPSQPSQPEGSGFQPNSLLSVWSLHVLLVPAGVAVRLIGGYRSLSTSVSMNGCLSLCVSPCD